MALAILLLASVELINFCLSSQVELDRARLYLTQCDESTWNWRQNFQLLWIIWLANTWITWIIELRRRETKSDPLKLIVMDSAPHPNQLVAPGQVIAFNEASLSVGLATRSSWLKVRFATAWKFSLSWFTDELIDIGQLKQRQLDLNKRRLNTNSTEGVKIGAYLWLWLLSFGKLFASACKLLATS